MFARESERLKEFNPFSMPCVQLVLAIDVRQSLMIQIKYKGLEFEVVILILQSPNNGIDLLIISGIVKS